MIYVYSRKINEFRDEILMKKSNSPSELIPDLSKRIDVDEILFSRFSY